MIWQSPFHIKGFQLKNRIVFPPISTNWATSDGSVNQKIIEFYHHIAKGGCSMITVGGTAVSQEGKGTSHSTCLYTQEHLASFKKLCLQVKSEDVLLSLQLMHVGGQGNPDFNNSEPKAPSSFYCEPTGCEAKALTLSEIKVIENDFINSATMAYESGFDSVELHLAHGYLLHEFLSPHFNKRMDEYGGNVKNRLKIVTNIVCAIKRNFPNKILGIRISGEDYMSDGISFSQNKEILPILIDLGIDYISITAGVYKTGKYKHEAMKKQAFFDYAKEIKSTFNIPIISVGKILNLEDAEKKLYDDDCDLVAMGRAMISDPYIIQHTLHQEDVIKCIECDRCSYLRFNKKYMTCSKRDFEI